jgi:glycosyltransferase involved in cell wall biosynthesis
LTDPFILVAEHHSWLRSWRGPIISFAEADPARLAAYPMVVLAPGGTEYRAECAKVFEWKRSGALGDTRLVMGTYVGRHVWSPENDALVERWVVHGRSEGQVLKSDRLAFVPLCVMPPRRPFPPGDDGFLFMGGRKWREPLVGLRAMMQSGRPGRVITDIVPEGEFPGIVIQRERIPKDEYKAVLARSRLFLVPLKETPMSHGHVDVVTAITLGKPVLVTAGCSCDDYIEHGVNGLLVRDNSVEAWVEAIAEAWPRADEMAAAALARAPDYVPPRYADYLRAVCEAEL